MSSSARSLEHSVSTSTGDFLSYQLTSLLQDHINRLFESAKAMCELVSLRLSRFQAHYRFSLYRHGAPDQQVWPPRANPSICRCQRAYPDLSVLDFDLAPLQVAVSPFPRLGFLQQNMQHSEDVHIRLIISRGVKNTPHQNPLSTIGVSLARPPSLDASPLPLDLLPLRFL